MKKVLLVLTLLTSLHAMADALICKPTNPDETIYNIQTLKVETMVGIQKYLIREDKIAGTSYKTYLEAATNVWTLNKYEVVHDGREDILAQVDMTCSKN